MGGGGSAGPSSTTWRRSEALGGVLKPQGCGVARGEGARPGAAGHSCFAAVGDGLPGAHGERGRQPRPTAPAPRERVVVGWQQVRVGVSSPNARGALPGRGSVAFLVPVLLPVLPSRCPPPKPRSPRKAPARSAGAETGSPRAEARSAEVARSGLRGGLPASGTDLRLLAPGHGTRGRHSRLVRSRWHKVNSEDGGSKRRTPGVLRQGDQNGLSGGSAKRRCALGLLLLLMLLIFAGRSLVLSKVLNFLKSESKTFNRGEDSGKLVFCVKVVIADNFLTGPKRSTERTRQRKRRYWQLAFNK